MNTRILHIFGSDYAAKDYEKDLEAGTIVGEQLWEESWEAQIPMQAENNKYTYQAYKFGEVDSQFLKLTQELLYESGGDEKSYIYKIGN